MDCHRLVAVWSQLAILSIAWSRSWPCFWLFFSFFIFFVQTRTSLAADQHAQRRTHSAILKKVKSLMMMMMMFFLWPSSAELPGTDCTPWITFSQPDQWIMNAFIADKKDAEMCKMFAPPLLLPGPTTKASSCPCRDVTFLAAVDQRLVLLLSLPPPPPLPDFRSD